MVDWFKKIASKITKTFNRNNIRYMIFLSFTLSAMVALLLTGVTLYARFSDQLNNSLQEQNQSLVEQANKSLSNMLNNTNNLSNSIAYDIVKGHAYDEEAMSSALGLFYQANPDTISSISLFSEDGHLIITVPAATDNYGDVSGEEWFNKALIETADIHYFTPRTRLLDSASDEYLYNWVVTASCSVELTSGSTTSQGVLLIEMKYDSISNVFNNVILPNNGYIYLTDANGTIIYHPKHQLITSGVIAENNLENSQYRTGTHAETFNNQQRTVIVDSVAYTGWKIIAVIPESSLTFDAQNVLVILIVFFFYFGVLTVINSFISTRVTNPLHKLEQSVIALEQNAADTRIYSGGTYEIQHLGRSIQKMVDQMRKLADDIVKEHENKRISELNALQAQINPHFLYNTLDIIVWMVENEKPGEAVKIVSALARLFRVSLSKGKNIITVSDELDHVLSYLTIQQMRYKEKFRYNISTDSKALDMGIIKLVVQPLVENAIYHSMDYMDGDGIIDICTEVKGKDLYICVEDNGLGMTPETVKSLLTSERPSSTKGSGIGLKNVNERIKLYFGKEYGIAIESEPDEGTRITIRMPAIPYDKMEDKANGQA